MKSAIKKVLRLIIDKSYAMTHKRILHDHRNVIARDLYDKFGGVVNYGVFKGLKLVITREDVTTDFPSMFFGTYEEEVLNSLKDIPPSYTNFINLGAGDGYYPIGVIKSGIFSSAIAFEGSVHRRNQIRKLAEANGCLEYVEIREYASDGCFDEFESMFLSQSVILSDIEGGEFDIFTEKNLKILCGSIIIIEIHDFLVSQGKSKFDDLVNRASKDFEISWLTTTSRDPSRFEELHHYSDIDRWITMAEGR
jgi:hypothetical protein